MSGATYHIKETKDSRSFTYSGELREAIAKAEKDLQKEKENKEIEYWKWIEIKANKAITAHKNKIERIEHFLAVAKRELEKQKKESEA